MQLRLIHALMTVLAALASWSAQAQTGTERTEYWSHGWDWGWGHMIFGSLMMIFFWGGIILIVVLAFRRPATGSSHASAHPSSRKPALSILEERFARGEIDKPEFEERKALLSD